MLKPPAAEPGKQNRVRVDLDPAVHKALRKKAADQEVSMAKLARTIITRELGFKTE